MYAQIRVTVQHLHKCPTFIYHLKKMFLTILKLICYHKLLSLYVGEEEKTGGEKKEREENYKLQNLAKFSRDTVAQ